jgi:hypothetical protein
MSIDDLRLFGDFSSVGACAGADPRLRHGRPQMVCAGARPADLVFDPTTAC